MAPASFQLYHLELPACKIPAERLADLNHRCEINLKGLLNLPVEPSIHCTYLVPVNKRNLGSRTCKYRYGLFLVRGVGLWAQVPQWGCPSTILWFKVQKQENHTSKDARGNFIGNSVNSKNKPAAPEAATQFYFKSPSYLWRFSPNRLCYGASLRLNPIEWNTSWSGGIGGGAVSQSPAMLVCFSFLLSSGLPMKPSLLDPLECSHPTFALCTL